MVVIVTTWRASTVGAVTAPGEDEPQGSEFHRGVFRAII